MAGGGLMSDINIQGFMGVLGCDHVMVKADNNINNILKREDTNEAHRTQTHNNKHYWSNIFM